MAPSRIVLVINPRSQTGSLGRRWPELASRIRREIGSFEEAWTQAAGDATRLTREALEDGADTVVAIGGDGTISEVANGFFDGTRPLSWDAALGVIPFGTGGDFRKTVHIAKDVARAARTLAARNTQRIDVGHLTFAGHEGEERERIFINIASFGISGLVDSYVNESSKRLGGKLSFLLATARAGLHYENKQVRMTFDGVKEEAVEMTINTVAVSNGRYFGGGMYIAPDAEIDDGFFDVVALGDLGKVDFLRHGRRLYNGTHLQLERVSHRRAKLVQAEPLGSEPVRLDVDGETPGALPATFRILPRSLKLIVP